MLDHNGADAFLDPGFANDCLHLPTDLPQAATTGSDIDNAQITLDATGEFYLSSRRRDGAVLRQCRIEFDPGDQPCFLVAYLILRRIQHVADVLGSFPAMSDIEAGLCESNLVVLIAARDSKSDLIRNLGENLKQFFGVTRFDAATFA